jgi:RecB family endonuclease NucS
VLPEALRLIMVKSDGSVLLHADTDGYKPLNCSLTLDRSPDRIA